MSSYLSFRKNGVRVGSYSRSSKIYQVFENAAPFGEWGKFEVGRLEQGVAELKESIETYNQRFKSIMEMMPYTKNLEEVRELKGEVDAIAEEIKEINWAIGVIHVYEDIFDPYDREEGETVVGEWMLD